MSINYKGIALNEAGDPAPWATKETDAFKEIIDSIVIDTVSGSASDAKVNGHKHFKLYSETNGDLVLSIDPSQKASFSGDVEFNGGLQLPSETTPGFVKNDGAGNLTFGNVAESVPGGSDTSIQYNSAGSFAGSNRMVFGGEDLVMRDVSLNNTVTLGSATGSVFLNNASGDNTTISPTDMVVEQNYKIGPNDTAKTVFYDGFTNNSITGWYDPCTLSVASITTFNINKAGIAFFIKKGSYPYTYVRLDVPIQNNIVANLGLPGREIHIFVDELGAVIQQSSVTSTDLLTKCYIGNLTKNAAETEISFETNQAPVTDSIVETSRVLIFILGGIQVVNMFIRGAGLADLRVSRTAGEVIRVGIESSTDRSEPDTIPVAAESPIAALSYRYIDENDDPQFLSNRTDLDPTQYYNKNTTSLAIVTNNNWSGQRVYYFAASSGGTATTLVLLGHVSFNTADDAKAAMGTIDEDFSKPQFLKRAVFLGWIIARGGGSNADSMSDVQYVDFNDPFELSRTGTGSSSGGSATMQSTYNASTIPQIVTDVTRGAVTYRRGSAADTDDVLSIENAATTINFSVKGNGYAQAERIGVGVAPSELLHINGGTGIKSLITGTEDVTSVVQTTGAGSTPYFTAKNVDREWRLKVDGSDSNNLKIEDFTGGAERVTINTSNGAVEVGPSSELVLFPQTLRGANGLPQGFLLMQAGGWSFELDTGPDTLRIGKVSPAGTELIKIGGVGGGIAQVLMGADNVRIGSNNTSIFQNLEEITPDFKSARFKYDNNSAASGAPADNGFRFNNADPLLATKLFVDHDPVDKPSSINYILENIANDSKVYIYNSERTIVQWYEITISSKTNQTGYVEYNITVNNGANSGLVNTQVHGLVFKEPAGGGGGGGEVTNAFFAEPTGTQAMANGVTIVPNMNNKPYDPDSVYSTGSDTFTAQTNGIHMITAGTKVSVSAGGQIESYLYINGSLTTTASGSIDTAGTMVANASVSIYLEIGDTVQLRAAQFTGFAGTMQTSETFISGHMLPYDLP